MLSLGILVSWSSSAQLAHLPLCSLLRLHGKFEYCKSKALFFSETSYRENAQGCQFPGFV